MKKKKKNRMKKVLAKSSFLFFLRPEIAIIFEMSKHCLTWSLFSQDVQTIALYIKAGFKMAIDLCQIANE